MDRRYRHRPRPLRGFSTNLEPYGRRDSSRLPPLRHPLERRSEQVRRIVGTRYWRVMA